jgi:hypothetical protein
MTWSDTLAFSDFDPVTGPPTMDGFVLPDPGVITNETEPGYVNGSRMTFGGSGFPPVVFQGVKSGNFLHLAFMCRGDLSFDSLDAVVVALRPSHATADHLGARRIDIRPVYPAHGADEPDGSGGFIGTPDDVPPGVPMGSNFFIRTNHRPAQQLTFYKGVGDATGVGTDGMGNRWSAYTPAGYTVPNPATEPYHVRVRSWKPAVATPPDEYAWSIELKIPISQAAAAGDPDWIDLTASFGLYFSVIRVTPTGTPTSTQFRFPQGVPGNLLTGTLGTTLKIESAWYGTGLIAPAGSGLGEGVRFVSDPMIGPLVGRRALGSSTLTLTSEISGTSDNELAAILENTSPTAAANGVTAEFRFANWGLGAGNFFAWDRPPGLAPNPTSPVNLAAAATNVALASPWPAASVPIDYSPPHQHQCVWVQLNSASPVNFVQSSVRRNMDFVNLSSIDRPAEISGAGYPPPPGGAANHDFVLLTRARKIVMPVSRLEQGRPGFTNPAAGPVTGGGTTLRGSTVTYLWITEGYRRTGLTLTIDGTLTEILDEAPGAFGYVAQHTSAQGEDVLRWDLSGPGLVKVRDGVYALPVPHNGAVTINTRVWTEEPGAVGPGGGLGDMLKKLPWWVWLILLLLIVLLILLLK